MRRNFKVGDWLVLDQLGKLENGNRSRHLKPKAMQLLVHLAENAGKVLSKDQLLTTLWEGAFVSDNVLMNSISELRKALDDDAKEPRFIDTIPKRGYRLVAPVTPIAPQDPLLSYLETGFTTTRLAVLPVENLGCDAQNTQFADVMTDIMITALAQNDSLRVISRTSIMRYQGRRELLTDILRELNVDLALEGTLLPGGIDNAVQMTLRLYDIEDGSFWTQIFHLPSDQEVSSLRDVAKAKAREITDACRRNLAVSQN